MFRFKKFYLNQREYAKICSEISDEYFVKYIGKNIAIHRSVGIDNKYYWYYFEIHGFNDYNIYMREEKSKED